MQLDQKEVESYDLTGLLQEATSYSWRMCTLNEAGACGDWATASFTTETTPPGPPTLLLPSPGADAVALLPLFDWDASGAETYELQLTTPAQGFTPPWVLDLSGLTQTQYALGAPPLETATLYQWRVRACNAAGCSAWSDDSFTTETQTAPPPPTLSTPVDGQYVGLVTAVELTWVAPTGGAASYTVEVADNAGFAGASSSSVTGLTYQVSELLLEKWYYWRVSSCNVDQVCGGPSVAHSFFTGSDEVTRYYYLTDHLGSVRATVKEDGTVVHFDDYYPFGLPMPGRSMDAEGPRERFTGHEMEIDIDPDEKAIYYAGARYYDGLIVRWGVVDPLAEFYEEVSPYNYALNNPLNFSDPTGMCPEGYKKGDIWNGSVCYGDGLTCPHFLYQGLC